MKYLALLLVLLASVASAATNGTTSFIGNATFTLGSNSGRDRDDVRICLIPDVQHMTAGKILAGDKAGKDCSTNPANTLCTGAYCTQSPYCKSSWRNTENRLLYNMAYEMTGQWGRMDYTGLDGAPNFSDNTTSFRGPMDHPKCDIILSLGDMSDQPTFQSGDPNDIENGNIVTFDDTAEGGGSAFTADGTANTWCNTQLSEISRYEESTTETFWRIIDESGVPYLPTKGNHDTKSCYRRMMNKLNFQSKSYFYAVETTDRQAWAILVPSGAGKPICVITLPDGFIDAIGTGDGTTAAERTFLTNNIGCGNNYPTIIEQHGGVTNGTTGPTRLFMGTTLQGVGNKVIAFVGGHYGTTTPIKNVYNAGNNACGGGAPGCGAQIYMGYQNWQDIPRHGGASQPQGGTVADSMGGTYTILRFMPQTNQVASWDWNPYYRSASVPSEWAGSAGYVNFLGSFTWGARFP